MLREFIEELKHNQNINYKNNLENKVDIDYILERLEDIRKELLENVEYFDYHNKNMTKKQDDKIDNIKESLTSKGVFENA
jgi:hypothetical protein